MSKQAKIAAANAKKFSGWTADRQQGFYVIKSEGVICKGEKREVAFWNNTEKRWYMIGWDCPVADGSIEIISGPLEI